MIRPLQPDDAPTVAALHVRAWHRAHADLVAPEDMPTLAEREAQWRAPLAGRAWVWDQDGLVVGVVGVSDVDAAGRAELTALDVDPPAQGSGVGGALHDHAVAALREAGATELQVWVFTSDGQARDFCAARGWRPDGRTGERCGVATVALRRQL